MFEFLLVCGLFAFSLALRSFHYPVLRKSGAVGILGATYLGVYFLTGSLLWAWAGVAFWFLLPWLEILTRIRNMRLPKQRRLRRKTPPSRDLFPHLPDLTHEMEELGYQHVEDVGWDWNEQSQFYRLFYDPETRTQAAICLAEQDQMALYYVSLSSRTQSGRVLTTWNYPFSYGLKINPKWKINRVCAGDSFGELRQVHQHYLRQQGLAVEDLQDTDDLQIGRQVEREHRRQIHHNLRAGVLIPAGQGEVRYSWLGLCFVWIQCLKDLIRLS